MKFGQLIQHKMRKIFLKKSYTKYVGKIIPSFSNFALKSKGHHFSITLFDILIFCNMLYFEMNFGNLD